MLKGIKITPHPLQGIYLIRALPCHCKPALSTSAPQTGFDFSCFPAVSTFPGCICTGVPASSPRVVTPGSGGTVNCRTSLLPVFLAGGTVFPSPCGRSAQQPGPATLQHLQLTHDLVPVRGLSRLRDPAALRLDHLHGGFAIVQESLEQL